MVSRGKHSEAAAAAASGSQSKTDCFIENVVSSAKELTRAELRALHNFHPLQITSNALMHPSSVSGNVNSNTNKTSDTMDMGLGSIMNLPTLNVPKFDLPTSLDEIQNAMVDSLEHIVSHNVQVLLIGASLGAAISAGVAIGLFSAITYLTSPSSSSSSSGSSWWNQFRISKKVKGWFHRRQDTPVDSDESRGGDHVTNPGENNDGDDGKERVEKILSRHLKVIVGTPIPISAPAPTLKDIADTADTVDTTDNKIGDHAAEQCRQCLNSITISLAKQRMQWKQVLRITVHLASDRCDAGTFRSVLEEYPCLEKETVVSIVFVERLEDDHASVQIEALVQTTE
jgi:enamine deaminase RidA (YjgF/YER057c/UK114 family)